MILGLFTVSGQSMQPSFKPGEILVVSSLPYLFQEPKPREIIIMKDPRDQKLLIKRIMKQEKGKFFVAGDNPKASTDSRTFGEVARECILGKVILKV